MDHWSRRQFVHGVGVAGVALAAGCGRLPFLSQQPSPTVPTIGYIIFRAPFKTVVRDLNRSWA